MNTAGRLARYTGANALHGLLAAACNVAVAALLYRRLGVEFGVAALVTNGMVQLNLLEEGVGTFLVTGMSIRRRIEVGAMRPADPDGGMSAAVAAYLVGALLHGLAFGLALRLLLATRPEAALLGLLGGLGLSANCVANLGSKVMEGREDYLFLRSVQSGVNLLRVGGVAALAAREVRSLPGYLLWFALTLLLLAAALVWAGFRDPETRSAASPLRARRQDFLALACYARPLLLTKGAALLSYRLDLWIVQTLAGGAASTACAMADAVVSLATKAIEVFRSGLLPVSVRSWRGDDRAWVRAFVLGASKASTVLVGLGCVVLSAALEPLLRLWFGVAPPTALAAASLLLFFTATTAFRTSVQVILAGQGQFWRLEAHFLVAGLLNLGCSLVATALLGGWGAALGTALAGLYLLQANLRAAEQALALERGTFARHVVAPGLAALAAGVVAGHLAIGSSAPWIGALVQGGAAAAAFGLVAWFLLLDASERRWVGASTVGRLRP